jgi:CARDB protein
MSHFFRSGLATSGAILLLVGIASSSPAGAQSWSRATPKMLGFHDVTATEFRSLAGLPTAATISTFSQEVEHEHQPDASPLAVDAPTSPEGAESMAKADAQTPAATTRFNAEPCGLGADASVAASKTHVIVTTRNCFAIFSKGGLALAPMTASISLFSLVLPAWLDSTYDGRVLFDEYTGRFFYGSLILNSASQVPGSPTANLLRRSKFALAVSKSGDPFAGWYLYVWDAVPGDGVPGTLGFVSGRGSDYDTVGIANGFYLESNSIGQPGTHEQTQLTVWRTGDLAAGKPSPSGVLFYDILGSDGNPADLQPARHHGVIPGEAVGGSAWILSRVGPATIDIWELRQTAPGPTYSLLFNKVTLSRPFATPPLVEQKGSATKLWVDNVGTIALHAVARGDSLHVTTQDAINWEGDKVLASAHYIQIKRGGSTAARTYTVARDRTFGSRSTIYDQPSDRVHYVYPFVEVNKTGDAVIVYGRGSANHYPEVAFSTFPVAGPDILPSRKLQVGLGPVTGGAVESPEHSNQYQVQLYDYNGIAVDPFDDTAIWMVAPFGYVGGAFRLAVGKVYGTRVPNLVVPMTSTDVPAVLPRGAARTLTLRFANHGDGASLATHATVVLRKAGALTGTTLATVSLGALPPLTGSGKPSTVPLSVTLPTRMAAGIYYLGVWADSDQKVTEYDEVDNYRLYVVTVQ